VDPIRCFLIERAPQCRRFLRRHSRVQDVRGPTCALGWHEASVLLDRMVATDEQAVSREDAWPKDDTRWPKECERGCGHVFQSHEVYQLFYEREWSRPGTGAVYTIRPPTGSGVLDADAAPVGAMWDADWFHELTPWHGPDGRSLMVRTPGGDWMVDGPVSRESTTERWIRTGEPPKITVQGIFSRRLRKPPWRDYRGVLEEGLLRELGG
jgi:hypothetical protein